MTIIMDEITELHIKQDLKELEKKIDAILKRLDEQEQSMQQNTCSCGGNCQCSTTEKDSN